MLTQEREDYLKTIYKLQQEESPVRTTVLAKALNIEPASVTGVIKRLAELKLVDYVPYKGVTLTSAGEKIALEVIRHHRLIELYLIETLGYSWDEVHDEAEKLEHAISELFEERISELLGHPEIDPHGAPIPTVDGTIAEQTGKPLHRLKKGQKGIVTEVEDDDPGLLRYLGDLGIRPGVEIGVIHIEPYGGPIRIRVEEKLYDIGPEAASHVLIEIRTKDS